jgi:copper chaperone CopZ
MIFAYPKRGNRMKLNSVLASLAIVCLSSVTALAADSTVTLSDVHLCCNSCVTGVDSIVSKVAGAKAACDRDKRTIAITAPDTATAQKVVNALVAGGYFGKSSDSAIKVEDMTGAKDGKVQKLEVAGTHLCCNKCVTTVKGVLAKVDGVKESTVVQKAPTFSATGDFKASDVFDALHKEGLSGKVAPAMAN